MQAEERVYSKEKMPEGFDEEAKTYRKTALTRAARVAGPFTVETSEGPLRCADGYLAVDARGYPYPIAADEFELIYEEAGHEVVANEEWRLAALDKAINSLHPGATDWDITGRAKKFYEFLVEKEKTDATAG
jgi:hypothetical protein